MLTTENVSAQAPNFQTWSPQSISAQWNWIITEPDPNYNYYYHEREYMLRRWREISNTPMNLVLVKKGDSRWLVVDVGSEQFPDMKKSSTYSDSYDFKNIGGNLTITSIPTDVFPENLAYSFPFVSKLNATGLKINQFQRIVFINAHLLNHLDFSYNDINKVPSKVFELATELHIIDLSHNKIDILEEYAFDNDLGESNITEIYLHDNSLTYITQDIFSRLINLEILSLNNNYIQEMDGNEFLNKPNLMELYLDNNHLTSVVNRDGFNHGSLNVFTIDNFNIDISNTNAIICSMHNLTETLNANNNQISGILTDNLYDPFIKSLFLSRNLMSSISNISVLHNLETLDMSHNILTDIESIHFIQIDKLSYLNISNNKISKIELNFLPNLEILDLSHNYITDCDKIYLSNLTKLHHLDLSFNNINKFDLSFLPKTINLEYLSLAYNKLEEFQLNFQSNSLETLQIDGNQLSVIDTNLKQFATALKFIGLNDNNYKCQDVTNAILLFYFEGISILNNTSDDFDGENETFGIVKGIKCLKVAEECNSIASQTTIATVEDKNDDQTVEHQSVLSEIEKSMNKKLHDLEARLMKSIINLQANKNV